MLGSYMDDIGIKSDQFKEACVTGKKKTSQFQQALFEQVYAADDFVIFKRMMIQKNIELQLQALELLRAKYGVLPTSLQPQEPSKKGSKKVKILEVNENETKIMKEVTRFVLLILQSKPYNMFAATL